MTVSTWETVMTEDEEQETISPTLFSGGNYHLEQHEGRVVVYTGSDEFNFTADEERQMFERDRDDFSLTQSGRPYHEDCNCDVCEHRQENRNDGPQFGRVMGGRSRSNPTYGQSMVGSFEATLETSDVDAEEIVEELEGNEEDEEEGSGNRLTNFLRTLFSR